MIHQQKPIISAGDWFWWKEMGYRKPSHTCPLTALVKPTGFLVGILRLYPLKAPERVLDGLYMGIWRVIRAKNDAVYSTTSLTACTAFPFLVLCSCAKPYASTRKPLCFRAEDGTWTKYQLNKHYKKGDFWPVHLKCYPLVLPPTIR